MPLFRWGILFVCSLTAWTLLNLQTLDAGEPCQILVVDESNNWPVPLVELTTNHHVRFVTDNAGLVAFDLPELMDTETWFSVKGHGYFVPEDGFGMRGVRLTPTAGGKLVVKVKRKLPAKRLGRITGAGLFAESQKLGQHLDWKDQGILGCDSVQNTIIGERMMWGWGDTAIAKYPLGIFDMTGGMTSIQPLTSFQPPVKLRYDYFVDDNQQPRAVAPIKGPGPTWLGGYATLPDSSGNQQVVAAYAKIKPPLETYEHGLCVWDKDQQIFVKHKKLWDKESGSRKDSISPTGHSVQWKDANNKLWLLIGDPFPRLKIPANFESWQDPGTWQSLEPQTKVSVRGSDKEIVPHRGSIAHNSFRDKWVCIFCQMGGDSSYLGELWYCEAESPMGPWKDAVQIVTHDQYTFYNPRLHSRMVDKDADFLLFEATYTHTFSKTKTPTPRYEYNQMLYRLDFKDLNLE